MALTKVTYSMIDGAFVNALDYGADNTGTNDSTTAIQNAVTAAVTLGQVVFLPAGTYKVTDTINIPSYTQIIGEHYNMEAKGYGTQPKGTKISFEPTTAKSLFVASGTPPFGTFRGSYSIQNLYLFGNSTDASGNSIYAIDVDSITSSTFQNLAIQGFRTGIRCYGTINNRFEYVRIIECYEQCILYAGNTATTDVWTQCYISNAPTGVKTTTGTTNISIRFVNCIFETLAQFGVDLTKESFGWSFVDCYSEDVPAAASPTYNGAMFRLGYAGTTAATDPIAYIIGGFYGGANDSSLIGDGIRFGEISGAMIVSPFFARYDYVMRGNTTTLDNSVTISGLNCIQSTGVSVDMTNKTQGFYCNGLQNTGSLKQNAEFGTLTASQRIIANTLKTVSGTNILPYVDDSYDFGRIDVRWNDFYASSGYVVTTPDGTKNYRIAVDNAGTVTATML